MKYRKKLPRGTSRKIFRKGAMNVKRKNISPKPMRGGIRL